MRKSYRLIIKGCLLLPLAVLTGCESSADHAWEKPDVSPAMGEDIHIFVNSDASFAFSVDGTTRGTGAFDKNDVLFSDKLLHDTFYVFAFRTHYYTTGDFHPELMREADFGRTLSAKNVDSSKKDAEKYHCLVDGEDYNYGMPMWVQANPLTGMPSDTLAYDRSVYGTLQFNFTYPTLGYNFFGYYLGDVDRNTLIPHRNEDRVYYDSLKVDGTQDILCGMAPKVTESFLIGKGFSKDDSLTINKTDAYSSFAASHNIYPRIRMKHQLARLRFYAFPRNQQANGMYITAVKVRSPFKGEFTVAARDTTKLGVVWSSETKMLELREKSVDGIQGNASLQPYPMLTWDEASMSDYNNQLKQKSNYLVGGDLLLPPTTEYVLELEYQKSLPSVFGGSNTPQIFSLTTPLRVEGGTFEMGKEYNILISVFGPEEIGITVDLSGSGWQRDGTPIEPNLDF